MDVTTYLTQLNQQVKDPFGAPFSQDALKSFMALAVREYSRYRPLKRVFGTGGLSVFAKPTDVVIIAVGGPFLIGSTIVLDPFTPWQETAVILDVQRIDPSISPVPVGTPVTITLTTPLTITHYPGAIIANSPTGLAVSASTGTYMMPNDFMSEDRDSFDLATGARRSVKKEESFYDGVYRYSQAIQGIGPGLAQNFLGGSPNSAGSYPGVPALPSGNLNVGYSSCAQYTFSGGDQKFLMITPTPNKNFTLDFYYNALQQPETIPDSDMDALIDYGQGAGLMSNAGYYSGLLNFKEDDVAEDPHKTAAALVAAAQQCFGCFDTKIRKRPMAITG